jgi:hypothetical protein
LEWKAVPESIFVIPSLPAKDSEEYLVDYTNWRKPRGPDIGWGNMYEEKDHHDAQHIYIEADLFVQFYVFHYPTRSSGITHDMILRLVRDHFHFRTEVMEWAAKVLEEMPECFSTIHYRRGDLNYPSAKISPRRVFHNTFNLFHKEEYIYIATDDDPQNFKKSFISIFEKRYKVRTLQDYKHIFSQIDEKWVPLVELIICTQGRVFVGTSYSTMTSYIHRVRGYMPFVVNKNFYYTSNQYENENSLQEEPYIGWDREYQRGFRPIMEKTPDPETDTCTVRYKEYKSSHTPDSIDNYTIPIPPLPNDWQFSIPHWENEVQAVDYNALLKDSSEKKISDYPAIVDFFKYFPMPKDYLDIGPEVVKTPFTDLTDFLKMLRTRGRNMFVAPMNEIGYLKNEESAIKLYIKINVVWESFCLYPRSPLAIFGALGDVGYVVFTLTSDNTIEKFSWRGLKIPPNYENIDEIVEISLPNDEHKVHGKPTFYDHCSYSGSFLFLDYGTYESAWLKAWNMQNSISSADVSNCYQAVLWIGENEHEIIDDEKVDCFKERVIDKTHAIVIDISEEEYCRPPV